MHWWFCHSPFCAYWREREKEYTFCHLTFAVKCILLDFFYRKPLQARIWRVQGISLKCLHKMNRKDVGKGKDKFNIQQKSGERIILFFILLGDPKRSLWSSLQLTLNHWFKFFVSFFSISKNKLLLLTNQTNFQTTEKEL